MNKNLFEPPMQNIELEFTEETFKDVSEKDIKISKNPINSKSM